MRKTALFHASILGALLFTSASAAGAQDGAKKVGASTIQPSSAATPDSASTARRAYRWFTHYPWNGVNMWVGDAVQIRTASHNEIMNGSMRIIGVQVTRDVWRSPRYRLAYVGEFLPALLVRSGAAPARFNRLISDPSSAFDTARIASYLTHDSYGIGLAPFGGEFTARLMKGLNLVFNTTAGGVLFNHVVPYGEATHANFTVSPGAALQWEGVNRAGIAFGYTIHHLSNMSFGRANPGINSHIFYLRITRLRTR